MQQASSSFDKLVEIMATLRGPEGCPWDKEQTADTIKGHLIEEAYEVIEAINNKDYRELKEELGDLLLQIVFHSRLAQEQQQFNIQQVIDAIIEKLIRRHPHIFAGQQVDGTEEVLKRWEEIKKEEKAAAEGSRPEEAEGRREELSKKKYSYLDGVPVGLPALSFSQRLQTKAARVGFDWEAPKPVVEKLREELAEFEEALESKDYNLTEKELGDLLFTIVNLARKLQIDSESSLIKAANIFNKRFRKMEDLAGKAGDDFAKLSLAKKEALWEEVKEAGEV